MKGHLPRLQRRHGGNPLEQRARTNGFQGPVAPLTRVGPLAGHGQDRAIVRIQGNCGPADSVNQTLQGLLQR